MVKNLGFSILFLFGFYKLLLRLLTPFLEEGALRVMLGLQFVLLNGYSFQGKHYNMFHTRCWFIRQVVRARETSHQLVQTMSLDKTAWSHELHENFVQ